MGNGVRILDRMVSYGRLIFLRKMVRERNKKVKSSAISYTLCSLLRNFVSLLQGCFHWKVEVPLSGPQMKKEKLKLDVPADSNLGFKRRLGHLVLLETVAKSHPQTYPTEDPLFAAPERGV